MICGKSRIKNPSHRVQQEFHCSCSARNETLVILVIVRSIFTFELQSIFRFQNSNIYLLMLNSDTQIVQKFHKLFLFHL